VPGTEHRERYDARNLGLDEGKREYQPGSRHVASMCEE
jgi:hypothetical protein